MPKKKGQASSNAQCPHHPSSSDCREGQAKTESQCNVGCWNDDFLMFGCRARRGRRRQVLSKTWRTGKVQQQNRQRSKWNQLNEIAYIHTLPNSCRHTHARSVRHTYTDSLKPINQNEHITTQNADQKLKIFKLIAFEPILCELLQPNWIIIQYASKQLMPRKFWILCRWQTYSHTHTHQYTHTHTHAAKNCISAKCGQNFNVLKARFRGKTHQELQLNGIPMSSHEIDAAAKMSSAVHVHYFVEYLRLQICCALHNLLKLN